MTTSGSETSLFFRERIYLVIVAPMLDQFSLVHEVAHVFFLSCVPGSCIARGRKASANELQASVRQTASIQGPPATCGSIPALPPIRSLTILRICAVSIGKEHVGGKCSMVYSVATKQQLTTNPFSSSQRLSGSVSRQAPKPNIVLCYLGVVQPGIQDGTRISMFFLISQWLSTVRSFSVKAQRITTLLNTSSVLLEQSGSRSQKSRLRLRVAQTLSRSSEQ